MLRKEGGGGGGGVKEGGRRRGEGAAAAPLSGKTETMIKGRNLHSSTEWRPRARGDIQCPRRAGSSTAARSCLKGGFQPRILKRAFEREENRVNASIFTTRLFSLESWASLKHNTHARRWVCAWRRNRYLYGFKATVLYAGPELEQVSAGEVFNKRVRIPRL